MARRKAVPENNEQSEPTKTPTRKGNHLRLRIEDLNTFEPLTDHQKQFYDVYKQGHYFIALHGVAGTGKTFIALYKALEEVLDKQNPFDKIVIVRSAVPSREVGHLPGDLNEKTEIYRQPYQQICNTLFGRPDAYQRLEEAKNIEFISTSFIRGMSFDDCIIIVDEMQNMTFEEIDTVMTRVGYRSKIIWCGDYRQTDLNKRKNDCSGILKFFDIAMHMDAFTRIEFHAEDIVRSSLVKDYIVAKAKYEDIVGS